MSLLTLIITLVVVGVLLYLINKYAPMDQKIKNILNVVVIVILAIWLLKATGLLSFLDGVKI